MANSWEDSKKKNNPVGLIVLLVIVSVLAGFLICNNCDIFSTGVQNQETVTKAETVKVPSDEVGEDTAETTDAKRDTESDTGKQKETSSDSSDKEVAVSNDAVPDIFSIELPSVVCSLADKKSLSIRVSLKLYFREKELEREILFKRDNIKLIVRKVFVTKQLSDIVVDALRTELQREINALLEQGTIIDIEFLDFKPSEE